ncbi:MAG: hypothetical protein WC242_01580 [Candidatus Paceibacterota bacterium]|jgi:hypothetical protein
MSKKIVSTLLTLSTIVWVSGLATFVPTAQAVTINDGDLIRGPDGIKTYIVNNLGYKRHIFNPAVFGMYKHFSWDSIKTVTQSVLDSYITSDLYRADGDTKVYSLEEVSEVSGSAIKHWLDMTPAEFTAKGYNWNQVFIVNSVEKDYYSTGDPMTASGVITPVGSVSVTLASNSPAASTFVQAQATADLAHYTFTNNSSSEVKVTGLIFNRIGVSADATLSNVYLFDGSVRLTDAATVSSGKVTFNASAGLFTIPANSSKTIAVKSSIADSTSGQTLGVALATVTSAATVSGSFPISGAIHSIASATLATVAIGAPLPSSAATTDPMNDVRIWESTFTVGQRKVNFTRLALRQINSILSADIQNFRLLIDGVQVASQQNLDANGYITFAFNKELQTGGRTVKVIADVIGGSSRIIQMSLRNTADVDLTDSEYGVNVLATGTFAASTANLTVNSGTMTVEKSSTSPSGNVVYGGSDVLLGEWKFTAHGEPIKVETLTAGYAHVNAADASQSSTLRNGKIMVNGSQVGSNTTTAKAGTSFTVNFTVTPGTPVTVQFRADLYDNDASLANVPATDKITAKLVTGSANASKTISLGTYNVPTADSNANQVTVTAGTMTLAKKTNYANQTINVPQTAFKVGEWSLTGGTTEDVNVHTLSVDIDEHSGTSFDYDDLTDMYIVYGSQTSTVKSTATAADNDWSVSFTLAKNQVMTVALYANIGSSVTTSTDSFHTDLTVTGTGATSADSISASSGDIEGQTIIYGAGSITATRSAASADAAIVADNQTVQTVAYKFETLNDSYTITEVVLGITNASAIANVNLKDGSTILKTLPGATAVTFSGLSVPVVANSSKTLTVELELSSVGTGAGTSGSAITTDFTSGKAIAGSTGVEAAISDSTSAGNAMYVYKAIPTVTKVTYSDVQLRNEEEVLLKFTIGSTGGDISWKRLFFDVLKDGATTLATSTTYLYDVTGGANTNVAGSFTGVNLDATTSAATLEFDATAETAVSGSRTYELRSTVSSANADGDYITTSLHQDAIYAAPTSTTAVESADADASIIWSDSSASSHDTTTADWSGDYLVKSLPVQNSLNW